MCTVAALGVAHTRRCNDPGMAFKASNMACGAGKGSSKPDPASALAQRQNFMARGKEHGFALNSGW